jgi:Protein of unknown function (DUF3592)
LLVCLLVLLPLFGLAFWLGIPAWNVRITGVQTNAVAKEIASCGADDYATQGDNAVTASFAFQYTGSHGQAYSVTSHAFCNSLYNDGEHITLWYLPNDPNSILTGEEATWLYVFTLIWLPITIVGLFFLWVLLKPALLSRTRVRRM